MEIFISLAGIEHGPYSEQQVRQYVAEGMLSPSDLGKHAGIADWAPLNTFLAGLSTPTPSALEPAPVPPQPVVSALNQPGITPPDADKIPLPPQAFGEAKKASVMGPSAPVLPSHGPKISASVATTSPLAKPEVGSKSDSRTASVKGFNPTIPPPPSKVPIAQPAPPAFGKATPKIVAASPPPKAAAPPQSVENPKKSPLTSLIRSLTAKTVPLRNKPGGTPESEGAGSTIPMRKKPEGKPKAETMTGPIVFHEKTKKLGEKVPPEPPVTGPKQVPLDPTKTKDAKIKPADLHKPKSLDDPEDDIEEQKSLFARLFPALIGLTGVLALMAVYYAWSPYHAANSLQDAVNLGNPKDLAAIIDFPALRNSLQEQLKNQATQILTSSSKANPPDGATLPPLLEIIHNSVDHYITPEGIADLLEKSGSLSDGERARIISPEEADKILFNFNTLPVKTQGLASFSDFVVDREQAVLHFQFQGITWKLNHIDLRFPSPSGSASVALAPVLDTFRERARARMYKGDWDGAIADLSQLISIDPQSSAAFHDRGKAHELKHDLDEAMQDYSQALTLDPQMATAFEGRANIKAAKNDLDGAIADYTEAVTLNPKLATAFDSRGNAKTNKGDLEGATADYTQAIRINPNFANAYSDRGFARQANNNLDGAIADYTQALTLKPKSAVVYYNRGLAHQSQGNLEAAIVDFDRAIAYDPKIAGAYFNRGNAKSANHDLDGAIADYTQALALDPKIALAYCNRGMDHQLQGNLDEAVNDYTQALALDPKNAEAYYNRSVIKAQKNDPDGAIADSSQAIDLDPKNAQAYDTRGFAKLTKGNLDGALTDLKQFCDLAPRDHHADHARLYLWLISKAQNVKTSDVDQELSDALQSSWNSALDDLITKTAAYFLGRITEADYLAASASADARIDQSQRCQAWYFTGMKRLLMGDKKGAIDAFHLSEATKQKDFCEYLLAKGELQALESAPAPNAQPSPAKPNTFD